MVEQRGILQDIVVANQLLSSTRGIVITEDNLVVEFNTNFIDLLGYDEQQSLLETCIYSYFPDKIRYQFKSWKEHYLSTDKELNIETIMTTKALEEVPVLIEIHQITQMDRLFEIYIIEDLRKYRTSFVHNSLNEDQYQDLDEIMRSFTQSISHDINNALMPILFSAEMIEGHLKETELSAFVENIQVSGKSINEKIKQLQAYTGEISLNRELLKLDEIIGYLKTTHTDIINWNTPKQLPTLFIDKTHITNALDNIIHNALEALENIRDKEILIQISVTSQMEDENHQVFINNFPYSRKGNNRVKIIIEDNGPGVHPEIAHNLARPFYSTYFLGRGLGLAATTGIIKAHAGYFALQKDTPVGAKFIIELPIPEDYRI